MINIKMKSPDGDVVDCCPTNLKRFEDAGYKRD